MGRGVLDFEQDRVHPPTADRPHPLRLATSLVIKVVTDGSLYEQKESSHDPPMLIMTYGAILSLAILRDPFTQLDRAGLLRFLRTCQQDDGGSVPSFTYRMPTDEFVQFYAIPRE
jgi:prenyltransferase beta subunit